MMDDDPLFDHLVRLGAEQQLNGWNFSWLKEHARDAALPWDYHEIVAASLPGVRALLDLGTGGGEFLASLAPLPPLTWATEGYPPNVPLARAALEPLGARVADVSSVLNDHLPFDDTLFDLVIDRHTGVRPDELFRVLKPGGRYITQQVGGENCMDLNRQLEKTPTYEYQNETLALYVQGLEQAGMRIVGTREAFPEKAFLDVAGVVFYLKAIPWQIPDFDVEKYRAGLRQIHEIIKREGEFVVHEHRFLVEAVKPGGD